MFQRCVLPPSPALSSSLDEVQRERWREGSGVDRGAVVGFEQVGG
jgi:hypothetical protein